MNSCQLLLNSQAFRVSTFSCAKTMEKLTSKINYAEKIDKKFPEIEKFLMCWVQIKTSNCHTERGLMLPISRRPDWHGNIKDIVVLRCVDNLVEGEELYAMIEVDVIKSIEIDRELEKEFQQSERDTPERQKEMLGWFESSQTLKEELELSLLKRKMSSLNL